MRKFCLVSLISAGLLSGCNMTHLKGPPAAMDIKGTDYSMIGHWNGTVRINRLARQRAEY